MNSNKKKQKQTQQRKGKPNPGMRRARVPAAASSVVSTYPAMMRSVTRADGKIRVSHREFVCDVSSRADFPFIPICLPINPGMKTMFSWLSHIAEGYDYYTFTKLAFEYVPSVSTAASGSVMLAIDYDALDVPPSSKMELMSNHGAVRTPPYVAARLTCDAESLKKAKNKYIRHRIVAGSDLKTYDIGQLIISALTSGAVYTAGEVYVDYEIELTNPHVPADDSWADSALIANVVATKAAPLTGASVYLGDAAEPLVTITGANTFVINEPGQYTASVNAAGTGITADIPGFTTVGGQASSALVDNLHTPTYLMEEWLFNVLVPNALFTIAIPAAYTTLTALNLRLSPYKQSLG